MTVSRRVFVKGLAAGGLAAGFGMWRRVAMAQAGVPVDGRVRSDTELELSIGEQMVNFTGVPGIAHTVNGSLPAPILRWREGDTVTAKRLKIKRPKRVRSGRMIGFSGSIS